MFGAFATSAVTVALAETGDKTQLLAIVLASKFKKPVPIILGILIATVASNFASALVGASIASIMHGTWFQYVIALSLIGTGIWTLFPEKDEEITEFKKRSAFLTTLVCFFIAELGDKTQIAAIALGARYHDVLAVCAGTTLGMMVANVPAVFLGHRVVQIVPLAMIRKVAAFVFVAQGAYLLLKILLG